MDVRSSSLSSILAHYATALQEIGEKRVRRGRAILEMPRPVMCELAMSEATTWLPLTLGRLSNPFATLAELPWILNGDDSIEHLSFFLTRAADFSDDGKTWAGAYGPRLARNMNTVYKLLKEDPNSRRAVLPIFESHDIGRVFDSKDIPCTLGLVVQAQDDVLNLHGYMRSNDLVWGMSGANVPNWAQLLAILAELQGMRMGAYWHTATNLHVYSRHLDRLSALADPPQLHPHQYDLQAAMREVVHARKLRTMWPAVLAAAGATRRHSKVSMIPGHFTDVAAMLWLWNQHIRDQLSKPAGERELRAQHVLAASNRIDNPVIGMALALYLAERGWTRQALEKDEGFQPVLTKLLERHSAQPQTDLTTLESYVPVEDAS